MSSLGGLKRKKHATSIFNEYDIPLTCLHFSNLKMPEKTGESVLPVCPESQGWFKRFLLYFFRIILGNFALFLFFVF